MSDGPTVELRGTSEADDAAWGRVPGAQPPLRPRTVMAFWGAAAAVVAAVVLAVVRGPGPLDDPDPGAQRPGILVPIASSRVLPRSRLRLPGDGRRLLLLFARADPAAAELESVRATVGSGYAVVVVTPARDPDGAIARAAGMPVPQDDGAPIGYALVDGADRVRYATLDPRYDEHLDEISTVAGGLS